MSSFFAAIQHFVIISVQTPDLVLTLTALKGSGWKCVENVFVFSCFFLPHLRPILKWWYLCYLLLLTTFNIAHKLGLFFRIPSV